MDSPEERDTGALGRGTAPSAGRIDASDRPTPTNEAPSFEALFRSEYADLFSAMLLITRSRSEAEDVAQEAFLKLWETWHRIHRVNDPPAYLYRTAINLFFTRRRRAKGLMRRALHLQPIETDLLAEVDERDALMRRLASLTTRQRAAVVLTEILGFNSEDAGELLGIRPSTVRVLAKRARDGLHDTWGDHG
jgi:RNA polymerase sigma-70 factor (ECF subfamily)